MDKSKGNIENIWPISDVKNFVKDIDRETGQLIGRVELPMNKETLICPSTFGARSWNSGAYNPKTGLWYNDVLDFCGYLKPVEQKVDPKDYGTGHTGSNDFGRLVMAPDGRKPGKLSANDPLTGQRKWSVDMDVPGFSCVLTTGGGLVFNGDPMGNCKRTTPIPARCCGASTPAPACAAASSATRSTASSTSWWRAVGAPTRRS
jgi:alcohol dehydrogenase (cytochrome c)